MFTRNSLSDRLLEFRRAWADTTCGRALPDLVSCEMVVARPGDAVVVRLSDSISDAQLSKILSGLREHAQRCPGVTFFVFAGAREVSVVSGCGEAQ